MTRTLSKLVRFSGKNVKGARIDLAKVGLRPHPKRGEDPLSSPLIAMKCRYHRV